MRKNRLPSRLAESLDRVTGDLAPATPLAAIQRVWSKAVGEITAASAHPVAERDGVVTVSCETAAWSQQLDLMQADLLAALSRELPSSVDPPRELRFVTGRTQA